MPTEPWNKGKLVGPKKHLTPDHVIDIERGLKRTGALRDLALFRVGICSMLRASDLVKLKTVDIAPDGACAKRIRVRMQKTGEPVEAVLADKTRKAVDDWLATQAPGTWLHLFPGRDGRGHLTERQYSSLVKGWVLFAGLPPADYSTHSIRRSKAAALYQATGNMRKVQILLGHKDITTTVRYLGVTLEDALATAEAVVI